MGVKLPKPAPPPKIERQSIRNWLKAYNSRLDVGRTPTGGLVKAYNSLLYQDGVVGPRPSLTPYGPAMLGTCIGYPTEFVKATATGTTNYLITMQVVSGVANVYYWKSGDSTWTKAVGKNYNLTARAHFCPGDTFVLVTNGEDSLSYLRLSDMTIQSFNPLPAIGVISGAPSGTINTGTLNYPNRYRVAYTKTGHTAASASILVNTNKQRAAWASGDYIDVTIPVPTPTAGQDAPTRAQIYWGETVGSEQLVATIPMPTTGSSTVWRDDGGTPADPTHPAPNSDTSTGLPATRATIMFGQVFLFGIKNDIRMVYFGGTRADNALDFTALGGGGGTQVGIGKDIPVNGIAFRDNHGDAARVIVSKGTNGEGMRYRLIPHTNAQGDTTYNYYEVVEDAAFGTDSPDTLVVYNNAMFYLSRSGPQSTYTKAQVQTILSTDNVGDNIEADLKRLNIQALDKAVCKQVDGRLLYAVPNQATKNNEIWVLDLKRQGGWMLPFSIAADWIEGYTDNDGVIHTTIFANNTLYEFNTNVLATDNGVGFDSYLESGLIKFSDDGADWANVLDVTFIFLRSQGDISVTVTGYTEENPNATLGSKSVPNNAAMDDAGWGEDEWGDEGWGEVLDSATTSPQAVVPVPLELEEDVKHLRWIVQGKGAGHDYRLSDIIVRFVKIGTLDLD